jgi:hypothetical protein
MFAPKSRFTLPLALALALATASACAASNEEQDAGVRGSPELLASLQPADVAIAPLRNQTGKESVPLDLLRGSIAEALVEQLYSPLDNEYVDGNWVESSFRGTPAPDALLVVAITIWDPTRLYSTGHVEAGAELLLFEGGSTTGAPLWGRTIRTTLVLGDKQGNPPGPGDHLIPRAAGMFAREALESLPERDPVAAHP